MKATRVIALILAFLMLAGLSACAKNSPDETAGGENPSGTAANPAPATEEADPWAERDMTEQVEGWRGYGSDGKVEIPGTWETTAIKSSEDLAPYRKFFPNLSDEDAARITSDPDGVVMVLEIASTDLTLLYGTDTVTREDGAIVFQITGQPEVHEPEYDESGNEVEYPDPGSPYEYFLFYVPAAAYEGEALSFLVVS